MGDSRFVTECGGRIVFPFAGRLSVIDENDNFLLVDKPAGMPVHPSKPDERGTLWNHLCGLLAFECATGGAVSIITRLDRETSGLTLVAKHRSAARSLCRRVIRQKRDLMSCGRDLLAETRGGLFRFFLRRR